MRPINPDNTLNKYPLPNPHTELSLAVSQNDVGKLMQRHDKELMATDGYGNTLLIWAADRGALNCLNYLLEKKAVVGHINHRGYLGNTALSRAARGGHVRCVEALLSRPEIDPNIPNDKNSTLFTSQPARTSSSVCELLSKVISVTTT